MVVVALFAYMAMVRWKHSKTQYQAQAWNELGKSQLPSSLEDMADKYKDVGAVSHLARLNAASQLLGAVQAGNMLGAESETPTPLTEEARADYLDKADRLYTRIVEDDDQSASMTLIVANALTGRATVAESKGDFDQARQYYDKAAARAESVYPQLAHKARERAASVDARAQAIMLPSRADVTAMQQKQTEAPKTDPVWMEPWMRELVLPADGSTQ